MKYKEWTINQVLMLQNNYYSSAADAIKQMFPNRTSLAIYNKALSLGLRERWKYQPDNLLNDNIKSNNAIIPLHS